MTLKIPWKPLIMVALHKRGGSSTLDKIYSDFRAGVVKTYSQEKFTRQIRPALAYLRNRGLIENPKRGLWKLSPGGYLEVARIQERLSKAHPKMSTVPLHLLIEALRPFDESI
jgi:hypothetical protein